MGDKWTMRQRGESSAVSADPKKSRGRACEVSGAFAWCSACYL